DFLPVSEGTLCLLAAGLADCVRRLRPSSFRLWARPTCRSARNALVRSRVGPAVVGVSRKTTGPGYVRLAYRVKSPQVTACARAAIAGSRAPRSLVVDRRARGTHRGPAAMTAADRGDRGRFPVLVGVGFVV